MIFDLDGTLTDSAPGIVACVRAALEEDGAAAWDEARLWSFLGPPLFQSFKREFGMDDERCERAVASYRKHYAEQGIYNNAPYEGIPALLEALKRGGARVGVATSKPRRYAETILNHFGLNVWVDALCGAEMSDTGDTKQQLIRKALCALEGRPAVMVGDRHMDVEGAHAEGIPAVYALYGYGSREEGERCGADFFAADVNALRRILCG